ncbi:MAG: DUF2461 domain-containing protein [Ignavibacteria bacterium]
MLSHLIKEPFLGFQPEALKFLKALSNPKNNNREWFENHRDNYENYLKQPMKDLIDTLAGEINKIDPNIVVNYKSIFRINRDIRFSKNKTPYKNLYSAAFVFDRIKSAELPHFYFQFTSNEFLFAGGQYSMDSINLKKIRKAIYINFDNYESIVTNKKFKKVYGDVLGESLTRLPKGYENLEEINVSPLLIKTIKQKQFYVYKKYEADVIMNEKIVDIILDNIILLYDFTKFLYLAIK